MQPPEYFEAIRRQATNRWEQLEADPGLAGPWHQLFKQVQSPRHVISELLQNAEDARATLASIAIEEGEFIFSHNGEDFAQQHFSSLCNFGFSNKRALHTIGFRGIGFKSTFSLGSVVHLTTPTLAVLFRKKRFTEPHWSSSTSSARDANTIIRVAFKDAQCRHEIKKNLDTWIASPASLLFFRSLRRLKLGEIEVAWRSVSQGPVPNSEWVALAGASESPVLVIRSELEEFPDECVAEINEERMTDTSDDGLIPTCRVELVLGLEGRLFVVLPTGVTTRLPFACNAPFVQDPARVKIKDPETSPTNRWLLRRAGALAARVMLQWLRRTDLPIADRAGAYRLLPPAPFERSDSIEETAQEIVAESFRSVIKDEPFLLTSNGELTARNRSVAIPRWLPDVWTEEQIAALFDQEHRPLLSSEVDASARTALLRLGYLEEIADEQILGVLRDQHVPRPQTWRGVLNLWSAVMPHVSRFTASWQPSWKGIRIVPVKAQATLFSAAEVVRLGEKKLLQSDEDWDFLSDQLLVMDPYWPRFVGDQRRNAVANQDENLANQAQAAEQTFTAIGLAESSDANVVIGQVADAFFAKEEVGFDDCIRIAQIAAKLSVQVSDHFQFVTVGGTRSCLANHAPLVGDSRLDVDLFAEDSWCDRHVLHGDYWTKFRSCTPAEWKEWLESGKSGIAGFIPVQPTTYDVYGRPELQRRLSLRGFQGTLEFPYVTHEFVFDDWDFGQSHWNHWELLAQSDKNFWVRLLERILSQPKSFWTGALAARVLQVSTSRGRKPLAVDGLLPIWLLKLRDKACLQDTWGTNRVPSELLRRTPQTESLLDVEPFVRAEFDTETTRPLLARLGVRDTPAGPQSLLSRLSGLAAARTVPLVEVQKWCHRLDQLLPSCTTEELESLKSSFQTQKLILTSDNSWATSEEVFLLPHESDVPGAAIVHESLRYLTLWTKLGVNDRPTFDLVLRWLKGLPKGQKLAPDVIRRLKDLLPRHPHRIWNECKCWLNLEGEWTPIEEFQYSLSMRSLSAWGHLFPKIKKQIADFQPLSADVLAEQPFSQIPSLASRLEERVDRSSISRKSPITMPWIVALAQGLRRYVAETDEQTAKVRALAERLSRTVWQSVPVLESLPYLDGTPAGTSRAADVLWEGEVLYVRSRPVTAILRPLARELARPFDDTEIEDAIKFCIDRTPDHVQQYLEQNFDLADQVELPPAAHAGGPEAEPEHSVNDRSEPPLFGEVPLSQVEVDPTDSAPQPSANADAEPPQQPVVSPEIPLAPIRTFVVKPKAESLFEKFARASGFKCDVTGDRYFHADGHWIEKQAGQPFQWQLFSHTGHRLTAYFVREQSLHDGPIQIASEVWEAMRRDPNAHSMLVQDRGGAPLEITGSEIATMVATHRLEVFPATYRILYSGHGDDVEQYDDLTGEAR